MAHRMYCYNNCLTIIVKDIAKKGIDLDTLVIGWQRSTDWYDNLKSVLTSNMEIVDMLQTCKPNPESYFQ